jgi:hypothetical protein
VRIVGRPEVDFQNVALSGRNRLVPESRLRSRETPPTEIRPGRVGLYPAGYAPGLDGMTATTPKAATEQTTAMRQSPLAAELRRVAKERHLKSQLFRKRSGRRSSGKAVFTTLMARILSSSRKPPDAAVENLWEMRTYMRSLVRSRDRRRRQNAVRSSGRSGSAAWQSPPRPGFSAPQPRSKLPDRDARTFQSLYFL